jgi:type I restriction enzyme M protein
LNLVPGQLFYSTQIPVCLWFLAKNKNAAAKRGFRDRRHQTDAALSQA